MSKSKLITKKLDSRFTGNQYFKYQVTLLNLPEGDRFSQHEASTKTYSKSQTTIKSETGAGILGEPVVI